MTDDLTSIGGIGKRRAAFLTQHFGVKDLAGLARLDPAVVTAAFAEEGGANPPGHLTVASWISEARTRSGIGANGWQTEGLFMVVVERRDGEWQTIARHVDTDSDQSWPGVSIRAAADWIRLRLASEVEAELDSIAAPAMSDMSAAVLTRAIALRPEGREEWMTPEEDGNIHVVIPSHVPIEVTITPEKGVDPARLTIRINAFAGQGKPPAERAMDDDLTVRCRGLEPGLYQIHVLHNRSEYQQGPLFMVD